MVTLADLIEEYIKHLLQRSSDQVVEINRAQVAQEFRCVPSQINYVLTTRFTADKGYIVESRRGGGGYVRIVRLARQSENRQIASLFQKIGDSITAKDSEILLDILSEVNILPTSKIQLIKGILQRETANFAQGKNNVRASLLRAMLILAIQNTKAGGV